MGHAELAPALLTPEEYLAAEELAHRKHEYIGGVIYAMAGAKNRHNRISDNVFGALYGQLRGRDCQSCNSDTKVRIQMPGHVRFYYPDVQVVCRPNPAEDDFQDEPAVIIEVISERTRRTDGFEKREGYLTLPSLHAYLLIEQRSASATVWRWHSGAFEAERWEGLDATIPLPEIEAALPLAEVYEGVVFPPAHDEDEELR